MTKNSTLEDQLFTLFLLVGIPVCAFISLIWMERHPPKYSKVIHLETTEIIGDPKASLDTTLNGDAQ